MATRNKKPPGGPEMSEIAEAEHPGTATDQPAVDAPATGMGDLHQFVIFHVAGEMFAVSLSDVREIIRMPDVVRVPLSPLALEGLANLRGTVLPIIQLRRIFGMEPLEHNDATRVVVLDQGQPVGLVVDRMANVVTVDGDKIEPASSIEATVRTAMMTGMI